MDCGGGGVGESEGQMRTDIAKAAVGQTPPGTKILTLFSY